MTTLFLVASLVSSQAVAVQKPVAFEVASIKANNSGERGSSSNGNKGEILIRNTSLKRLVEIAYRVKDYSFNGPDWMDSLRFDINAKFPEGSTRDQYPAMLQNLLAERFKLTVHWETQTLSGYALVPGKGSLKLETSSEEGSSSNSSPGHFDAKGFAMKDLAEWLSRKLNRPVVDKTSIPGTFNMVLEFGEEERASTGPDMKPAESTGPSIFTALQEQWGLRLTGDKVPVQIVVVDHIERVPTDN